MMINVEAFSYLVIVAQLPKFTASVGSACTSLRTLETLTNITHRKSSKAEMVLPARPRIACLGESFLARFCG